MSRNILNVGAFADFKMYVGHRLVVKHEAESLLHRRFGRLPIVMLLLLHLLMVLLLLRWLTNLAANGAIFQTKLRGPTPRLLRII